MYIEILETNYQLTFWSNIPVIFNSKHAFILLGVYHLLRFIPNGTVDDITSDIGAVGTTFNVFSNDAMLAENRTNYLPNAERMHYVLRYSRECPSHTLLIRSNIKISSTNSYLNCSPTKRSTSWRVYPTSNSFNKICSTQLE